MTNPIYHYPHPSGCTADDRRRVRPERQSGRPPSTATYLYGDFVCGKIVRLTPTGAAFTATDFVTDLGMNGITSMKFGPHGTTQALYYMNYLNGGEVRRIAFTGTVEPRARGVATANPTSGPLPSRSSFDGRAAAIPTATP